MVFKDYYMILGLNTNRVSVEEIKNAFREQAKKYHPDVNKENKFAEERFKDINEAYRILSGSNTKRKYDRLWNSRVARKKQSKQTNNDTSAINNMFSMFFGTKDEAVKKEKRVKEIKGENVETEITINLEDAYFGTDKKITLRAVNGKMKTFAVKIPAGIRNGEKIRLVGQGKQGLHGGKNGDLFIKINIMNTKKFKLNGYDLETDLFLTPWEAALGKRLTIQSIEEDVSLFIPAGVGSGEDIKIAKKGYRDGQGGRGDLVAHVKIVVPKELTEKEKDLFNQLSELSEFNPRTQV